MGNQEQIVFQIILHGGNSRSLAMEALAAAKKKDFLAAREKLKQASAEINKAHLIQTNLIQSEAAGVKTEVSLLMVHAQDHLMNAITVKDLAAEFVDLYESI